MPTKRLIITLFKPAQQQPIPDLSLTLCCKRFWDALKNHQGSPLPQSEYSEVRDKVRVKFGISSGQIIELIRHNSNITLDEIADTLSVTRRAIEKKIKELRDAGYIRREGSNKSGCWVIIE